MANQDLIGIGAVSKALELATKEVRELIHKFLSPATEEAGQMFADRIRVARLTNIAKLLTRSKERLDRAGVHINPVALKTFLPILEGCSLEEDDNMVDKWSNLLSAAASRRPVLPSYSRILSELTPQEARIIDKMLGMTTAAGPSKGFILVSDLRALDSLSEQEFQAVLLNLQALRLLERKFKEMTILASSVPFATKDDDLLGLTLFGNEFAKAISCPPDPRIQAKE